MHLEFSHRSGHHTRDISVEAGATATVADLVAALNPRSANLSTLTLSVETVGGKTQLDRTQLLSQECLPRGAVVQCCTAASPTVGLALPTLVVTAGPHSGDHFTLMAGSNSLGRNASADISLNDPAVSGRHARVVVAEHVEIIDENSANGLRIDGVPTARARVTERARVLVGDTEFRVEAPQAREHNKGTASNRIVRSPRLRPTHPAHEFPGPDLPKRPVRPHFPLTMLIAPLFMGAALYAITGRVASLLFVALMPMMMIGMWFENRRSMRRQTREGWRRFRADLDHLAGMVADEQDRERLVRHAQHPSAIDVITSARNRTSQLWSRRPDLPDFGSCRLGVGSTPSLVTIARASSSGIERAAWNVLEERCEDWAQLPDSPIAVSLAEVNGIAVVADANQNAAVAAGLVLQMAALHSPSELRIMALLPQQHAAQWDWLKWLPHTTNRSSVGGQWAPRIAIGETTGAELLRDLENLIAERREPNEPVRHPLVLLLVTGADWDIARLATIAEVGPTVGVHLLWITTELRQVPAALRAFIVVQATGEARIGQVGAPESNQPVLVEQVSAAQAQAAARVLAPYVDATSRVADPTHGLPDAINYLSLVGTAMAQQPANISERWLETGSIASAAVPTGRPSSLRALLGVTAADPLVVDLIGQGPHALVGGTTGSGKSELLQTWVMALASDYSPDRLTFLFIDYKGGAAFSDCVRLPHSVGLVTDLTPELVQRALASLEAELKYREQTMSAAGCQDLQAMEQQALPGAPPRLVVVVDEFATLVSDVPAFVDGIVDIAQRGRSLGIHLILATQRPAGVIKDNLRANTNIRIALRMADPADSVDVIKDDAAAAFDSARPGRAALKCGSDPAIAFQSAWLGGQEADAPDSPVVVLRDFPIVEPDPEPVLAPQGSAGGSDSDLARLVRNIQAAATEHGIAPPRKPWLPPLCQQIDLADLIPARTESFLPLGYADNPELQTQTLAGFMPDRSGNLAIYGTTGAGKTTALTAVATLIGQTAQRDLSHVYVLDCASGALQSVQVLPQVGAVIAVAERERVARLFAQLQQLLAERSAAFSAVGATSLPEFRQRTGQTETPRVFLLLDGLAVFRQAYENDPDPNPLSALIQVATMGRGLGIHVIWTCERSGAVPAGLAAVTPDRVVLHLASADEATLLRAPSVLAAQQPPGRGFYDGREMQLACAPPLSDEVNPWSTARPAPIHTLPRVVQAADLPADVVDGPAIGISGASLEPIALGKGGIQLLAGGSQIDRARVLKGILQCVARDPNIERTCLIGPMDSLLAREGNWDRELLGPIFVAQELSNLSVALNHSEPGSWLIIVEDAAGFVNGPADAGLQEQIGTALWRSQTLLAEGDISSLQTSWPLLSQLRAPRRGFMLQPDQVDGDLLFRTPLPRIQRHDFSHRSDVGRGYRVQGGAAELVQLVSADTFGG